MQQELDCGGWGYLTIQAAALIELGEFDKANNAIEEAYEIVKKRNEHVDGAKKTWESWIKELDVKIAIYKGC